MAENMRYVLYKKYFAAILSRCILQHSEAIAEYGKCKDNIDLWSSEIIDSHELFLESINTISFLGVEINFLLHEKLIDKNSLEIKSFIKEYLEFFPEDESTINAIFLE